MTTKINKKKLTSIIIGGLVLAMILVPMKLTQVSVSALTNPYVALIEYDYDPYLYQGTSKSTSKLLALQFGQPMLVVGTTSNNMLEVEVYNGDKLYRGYVEKKIAKSQEKGYKFDAAFESKIASFPESYKTQLRYLHFIYPTWNFAKYTVNRDFNATAATYQTSALTQGNNGLNADVNVKEGTSWYRASLPTTKYFLDPRNYLYANRALAFQKLNYVSSETLTDAQNMLKSYPAILPYAATIYNAAAKYDASLFNVLTRLVQEAGPTGYGIGYTGGTATNDTSGIKYYNPYNIGAATGGQQGIDYAKKNGWDSREKGIEGGIKYLVQKYNDAGQWSQYLQRFDLNRSSINTHIYMTNIQAPYAESYKLIYGYSKAKLDEKSNITLYVPVFNNMPNVSSYPISNKGMNIAVGSPAGTNTPITSTTQSYSTTVKYTGSPVSANVVVKNGNTTLRENVDYALVYNNNKNVGTGSVTVYGMNGYVGSKKLNFSISKTASTTSPTLNQPTNTTPTTPAKNTEPAKTTPTTEPTKTTPVTPTKKNISSLTVDAIAKQTYTGKAITPNVTVKDCSKVLAVNKDYKVTYSNNVNAGTATVTITGMGDYEGSRNVNFTIVRPVEKINVSNATANYDNERSFTGTSITANPGVYVNGKGLRRDVDYTLSFTNNVNVGTATMTVTGIGNYTGTKNFTIRIVPRGVVNASNAYVADQVYNGKAKNPGVVLTYNGWLLRYGSDYTTKYSSNKKPGYASIKVYGKGNFKDTKTIYFKILPKTNKISSLKSSKKMMTVKYSKSASVSGYQIAYKLSTTNTWKYTTTSKTSRTISGLSRKKTYNVMVRSYKNSRGEKLYSNFSPVKSVKIK